MWGYIKKHLPVIFLLGVSVFFFYKFFFMGLIPFPGDLLMGNYDPYRSNNFLGLDGVPHKGQGADVIRELYPWKYFSIEQLKQGELPLWNPYVFSGNPHFANLQSGVLYPVNILFFIVPFIPAWSIYIVLQFVFMMVFMYLYLRTINIGKIPSVMGAVSFAFSSFMVVWGWYGNLGHALSFLPLILLSIEKIFASGKRKWYLLLIVSFVLSIFAGYVQFTIYIYLLAFLYVVTRFISFGKEKNVRVFLQIIFSFVISIAISAVQLVPLFELVSVSLRSTYSYAVLTERLMPPESVITLLIPDFFGNPATMNYFLRGGSSLERAASIGLWPLLFAVFAIFTKRSFFKIFFLTSAVISYVSTFSIPPIIYFHSIGIPFLSTGIPTRILSLFCFCLAVLAAIGMDAYLKNPGKRGKMVRVIILFAIIFILMLFSTFYVPDQNMLISRRNMIIPGAIFAIGSTLLFLKIPKKISISLIPILTICELFYAFQKFNSFVPSSYVYPETGIIKTLQNVQGIDRYWGYGSANIEANFQMMDKTYTTAGYDALYIKRYGEFIAASKNGEIPHEVPRSVADIAPGYGPSELKENPYRQRALDLTGVKYVLNRREDPGIDSAFNEEIYSLISEKDGWQVYENKQVLPRIMLFGRYQVEENKSEIIKKLYMPGFNYKNIVVLENVLPSGFSIRPDPSATISSLMYSPNKIMLTVSATENQLLFISDNYYPGWSAYVDDKETEIYRANYAFRAIPVEKGNRTIELVYRPFSFTLGLVLSGVGFVCLLVLMVFVSMRRKGEGDKKDKK